MDEVRAEVINIDNKEYFLLDKITTDNDVYCYFSNVNNEYDIQVLKDGGDEYLPLSNSIEFINAMELFNKKYN